jgi:hypothetical protein
LKALNVLVWHSCISFALTGAVDAHGKTKHLNIQNAQSYAMKYSLGAGESAYSSTVDGVVEMVGV